MPVPSFKARYKTVDRTGKLIWSTGLKCSFYTSLHHQCSYIHLIRDQPIMLLFLPIIRTYYAAVLINYAQYHAHMKGVCF